MAVLFHLKKSPFFFVYSCLIDQFETQDSIYFFTVFFNFPIHPSFNTAFLDFLKLIFSYLIHILFQIFIENSSTFFILTRVWSSWYKLALKFKKVRVVFFIDYWFKYLHAQNNQIEEISLAIGVLTSLKGLWLSRNNLQVSQ